MAKLNPFVLRRLVFITLVAAAFSFVVGMNSSTDQLVQQMPSKTNSTPQTSPLVSMPHKISLNPVRRKVGKSKVEGVGIGESEKFLASPKQATDSTQPQSLKPDIPIGDTTPPVQVVSTPLADATSATIPVWEQSVATFSVPTEFQAKLVDRVHLAGQEKAIALTFDDGPSPRTTLQVLDILDKNNIKATFFWVGQNLQAYPQIAQKVIANGHAIGNHTWHHWYRQLDQATAAHEIDATAELIYKTTGMTTALFRPPGGVLSNGLADYAKQKNYAVVMWSVDPRDYRPLGPQRLIDNVIRKAQPGTIVLLHDGGANHAATVKALPDIITKLRELGYGFVTVPELMEMKQTQQLGTIAKTQLSNSLSVPITQPHH